MKKCLLLFFISFALIRAHAQEKFPHWSIGFVAGPSFPTGNFGSKNPNGVSPGYASTGFSGEVTGNYVINQSWGLALAVGGQDNKCEKGIPVGPGIEVKNMQSKDWKIARILAGGVYTRPLSRREKTFLQIRMLAGILKTSIPRFSYDLAGLPGPTSTQHEDIPAHSLAWTFAYQLDAGLKFKLSKVMALVVNAGYSDAEPGYSYVDPSFMAAGARQMKSVDVPLSSFHLRAGVEISL